MRTGHSKLVLFCWRFRFCTKNAGGDRKICCFMHCNNREMQQFFCHPPAFFVQNRNRQQNNTNFESPVLIILTTYASETFRKCRTRSEDHVKKVSEIWLQFSLLRGCRVHEVPNLHFSNACHFIVDWVSESILCSKDSPWDKLSDGENRMSLSASYRSQERLSHP